MNVEVHFMFLNKILKSKQITKYKLSELSNVPYSTINDICNGKTDFNKCGVETVYKISKKLKCIYGYVG